jgi:hypothetical protein
VLARYAIGAQLDKDHQSGSIRGHLLMPRGRSNEVDDKRVSILFGHGRSQADQGVGIAWGCEQVPLNVLSFHYRLRSLAIRSRLRPVQRPGQVVAD